MRFTLNSLAIAALELPMMVQSKDNSSISEEKYVKFQRVKRKQKEKKKEQNEMRIHGDQMSHESCPKWAFRRFWYSPQIANDHFLVQANAFAVLAA